MLQANDSKAYKHIVVWKLLDRTERQELAIKCESLLIPIRNTVAGIRCIEIGADLIKGNEGADLVLYSEFESEDDFRLYVRSEAHQRLKELLSPKRCLRIAVDYQT
jgi:hypothetical protein